MLLRGTGLAGPSSLSSARGIALATRAEGGLLWFSDVFVGEGTEGLSCDSQQVSSFGMMDEAITTF